MFRKINTFLLFILLSFFIYGFNSNNTVLAANGMQYQWPTSTHSISSPYGMRANPALAGHPHRLHAGIDIPVPVGTPVYAAADGVVTSYSSWINGYGYTITIKHSNGTFTRYAHLSKMLVFQGTRVKAGQLIALSGASGNVTGACLHFEIRTKNTDSNDKSGSVDPVPLLSGKANYIDTGHDTSFDEGGKANFDFSLITDFAKPIRENMTIIAQASTKGLKILQEHLLWFFLALLTMDFAMSVFNNIFDTFDDISSLVAFLLNKILVYGFLLYIFINWGTVANAILNFFTGGASIITGQEVEEATQLVRDPTSVIERGITLAQPLLNYLGAMNPIVMQLQTSIVIVVIIVIFVILICFFMLGIYLALSYLEFYLFAVMGIISYVWAGAGLTRQYGANAITGLISCGLRIGVITILNMFLITLTENMTKLDYFINGTSISLPGVGEVMPEIVNLFTCLEVVLMCIFGVLLVMKLSDNVCRSFMGIGVRLPETTGIRRTHL